MNTSARSRPTTAGLPVRFRTPAAVRAYAIASVVLLAALLYADFFTWLGDLFWALGQELGNLAPVLLFVGDLAVLLFAWKRLAWAWPLSAALTVAAAIVLALNLRLHPFAGNIWPSATIYFAVRLALVSLLALWCAVKRDCRL